MTPSIRPCGLGGDVSRLQVRWRPVQIARPRSSASTILLATSKIVSSHSLPSMTCFSSARDQLDLTSSATRSPALPDAADVVIAEAVSAHACAARGASMHSGCLGPGGGTLKTECPLSNAGPRPDDRGRWRSARRPHRTGKTVGPALGNFPIRVSDGTEARFNFAAFGVTAAGDRRGSATSSARGLPPHRLPPAHFRSFFYANNNAGSNILAEGWKRAGSGRVTYGV